MIFERISPYTIFVSCIEKISKAQVQFIVNEIVQYIHCAQNIMKPEYTRNIKRKTETEKEKKNIKQVNSKCGREVSWSLEIYAKYKMSINTVQSKAVVKMA